MNASTTTIKERPILFSGPMVRAVLEGRKTQTRRVLKGDTDAPVVEPYVLGDEKDAAWFSCAVDGTTSIVFCPYGKVGNRLWVREALLEVGGEWFYSADKLPVELDADNPHVPAMISWAHHNDRDTCNPIHMPRWASRLTLEITNIRVERLQEINVADIRAEGVTIPPTNLYPNVNTEYKLKQQWQWGWDELNAKRGYSWESNPWVWVIEFKKL